MTSILLKLFVPVVVFALSMFALYVSIGHTLYNTLFVLQIFGFVATIMWIFWCVVGALAIWKAYRKQ
jgi:hypothetical protein